MRMVRALAGIESEEKFKILQLLCLKKTRRERRALITTYEVLNRLSHSEEERFFRAEVERNKGK